MRILIYVGDFVLFEGSNVPRTIANPVLRRQSDTTEEPVPPDGTNLVVQKESVKVLYQIWDYAAETISVFSGRMTPAAAPP